MCQETYLCRSSKRENIHSFITAVLYKMAMAGLEAQIREMMQCKICFEHKENQKQLPCQHTICLQCLNSLQRADSHYKCPICQREALVPNGGFEALPDSLMTRQLASMINVSELANTASTGPAKGGSELAEPAREETAQSEAALKLCNSIRRSEERLKMAESRLKAYADKQDSLRKNGEKMEEKIESLLEEYIAELKAGGKKKVAAIKEITEANIENVACRSRKLQETFDRARDAVSQMKRKVAEITDVISEVDVTNGIKQAQASLEILQDQMLTAGTDSSNGQLKAGDSVRLKMDVELVDTDFIKSDVDHLSVGYIHSEDGDGDCEAIFAKNSGWMGKIDHLEKSPTKHDLLVVGDKVKVKATVSEPHSGWGDVTAESIGILKEISDCESAAGRQVEVDFPESHDWAGIFDELEKLPAEPLKAGDEVWISQDVAEPARGWAGVNVNSQGTLLTINGDDIVVRFPECEEWKGLLSELERVRPVAVGDKVRVLKSVTEPKTGWAGITHKDEGIIKKIIHHKEHGQVAIIDFPNRMIWWRCVLSELELARRMPASAASNGSGSANIHRQAMEAIQAMDGIGAQQCSQQ